MMMRRPFAFLPLLLIAVLSVPGAASADQNDPRLPGLFDRLKSAESTLDAHAIEGRIWAIWMTADDEEVQRLMKTGVEAMAVEDYPAALGAFDRVVTLAPDFAEGWNKRATVYFLIGDYPASLRDINRTLALEPRHFGALAGLGLIHGALNEEAAALDAFERALAINPNMPTVGQNVEELRRRIGGREI